MLISLIFVIPVNAEGITSKTYTYDDYTINYVIGSKYGNNQNINVTITNTGSETIENWMLEYDDFNGDITSIWNAKISETDTGTKYIRNVGDNAKIVPNASVSFGYILTDFTGIPNSVIMCQERSLKQTGFTATLKVESSWGETFNGNIVLTNETDKPIEWWELTFDSNFSITSITNSWAASVIDNGNCNYTFKGTYTSIIAPNSSVTLGFTATKNGEPLIEDVELTEVVYGGSGDDDFGEPPIPDQMDHIVAFGEYDEEKNAIAIEWFYKDNIGDFRIYETSVSKELIAEVTDDSIYYFEVDDTYNEYVFVVENDNLVSNEVIMRSNGNDFYEFVIEADDSIIADIYDNNVTELQILNLDEYYPLEVQFNDEETQIMSISGKFSELSVKSPVDALYSIYSVKTLLGLDIPKEQFKFEKFNHSKSGLTYTFVQYYEGIEVFGSSITVSVDTSGKTVSLSSTVITNDLISNSGSATIN